MLNNFTEFILQLCQWFVNLVYLNLLWVLFTLLGGILFGIAPATYALFTVMRELQEGKSGKNYLAGFWTYYKEAFIWTQKIGFVLLGSLLLLVFDIQFFWSMSFTGSVLILFLFIGLLLIFLISISFLYPLMVSFDAKPMEYFKLSFFVGFKHLPYTILLLSGAGLITLTTILIPALLPLLLASSITMWITWLSSRILPEYGLKETLNEDG